MLFSTAAISQSVQVTNLNFPSLPASYCTNTILDVNITLSCINAAHTGTTVNIVGSTITVTINYVIGIVCLPAIGYPVHNVNLGLIPQGSYTVVVNGTWNSLVVSTMSTSLNVGSSACCPAQAAFTVSNDTICVGDSVFYGNTSTGATSHEWFEDNISVGTQTNYGKRYNIAGTYEIKLGVTDGNCSDTMSKEVLVSDYPTVDLGNDTTTCPGDPKILDAGAGRDVILWSTSATTRFLPADTAGNYIVTVTENGCSSQDSILISLFNAPPVVNLGNDTMICYGDNILLDATVPGVSYLWHDNSTGPTYVADTIGNYSVTIEDVNTCKSSDDINVSLFAQPTVSLSVLPGNTICYDSPYEFRAASFTQGSVMYQWIINGVNSGSPTINNRFSPNLNHGDSVAVQLLTDVCSSTTYAIETDYITMILNPQPLMIGGNPADTVLEYTSKNYLVPLISGSTFTWSVVGGNITTPAIGNAVSVDWGTEMDTAKIMVTEKDNANCSYTNVRNIVIKSIVGINDNDQHIGIGKAYPNPANTIVTIPVVSKGNWDVDLSLYDMTGKKVKAIYNGAISGNRDFTFAVDDLENGMYFNKVTTSDGFESLNKISIQH